MSVVKRVKRYGEQEGMLRVRVYRKTVWGRREAIQKGVWEARVEEKM